jgi:hypothetical protein
MTRGLGRREGVYWRHDAMNADGSGWSPTLLSGLVLWLRADMGITLAVNKVAAWADQSVTAANFAQGTDAQRPVFSAASASFAGQPCVQFAGAQVLDSLANLPTLTACTLVFAIANTPNQVAVVLETGTGATGNAAGAYIDNPVRYRGLYQNPNGSFTQYGYLAPPTSSSLIITIDPAVAAANQVRVYVDNVDGALPISNLSNTGNIAAALWHLGARVGLVAPATADIAEVIALDHVASVNERALIYAYQAARFG